MNAIFKLTLAVLAVATCAVLAKAQAADSVVGTWRLVSWIEEETESKAVHKNFGDNPLGFLTYTADGHMMLMFTDPSRKPAAAPKATDTEAAQLYRTMGAYAGRYTLQGEKVTHHIEISWNEAWSGTDQQRFVEVTDDQLTIKTAPFMSPYLNKQIVATLVWKRAK
jgi:lipocalin-like protein